MERELTPRQNRYLSFYIFYKHFCNIFFFHRSISPHSQSLCDSAQSRAKKGMSAREVAKCRRSTVSPATIRELIPLLSSPYIAFGPISPVDWPHVFLASRQVAPGPSPWHSFPTTALRLDAKFLDDSHYAFLQVQCVEVKAWNTPSVQQLIAHLSRKLYSVVFNCLVVLKEVVNEGRGKLKKRNEARTGHIWPSR